MLVRWSLNRILLFLALPLFFTLTQCIASGQIIAPPGFFEEPEASESEGPLNQCQSDTECGSLEICTNLICESRTPPCESKEECPQGSQCSGNLCLEEGVCYFHHQCPELMKCEDFRCVPDRCQSDVDCGSGEFCDPVTGACREPRCQSNSECGEGDCCYSLTGFCVPLEVCERFEKGIPPDCQSQPELCDQLDNDCDGSIDEDFPQLGFNCSVGQGICLRIGNLVCSPDQMGVVCNVTPGPSDPEVCDGVDNDCDGAVDEGC